MENNTIAIFASGTGTNFMALLDKIREGKLRTRVGLVVSNNPDAGALDTARRAGIPVHVTGTGSLLDALREKGIGFIVLAGYLKKVPPEIIGTFENRIINIHPALLPAFGGKGCYGIHVHEKVIAAGVKVTGVTVHFVNAEYDQGPIILQEAVEVSDDDDAVSLQKKVLKTEHAVFWKAVQWLVSGKLTVKGRRVLRGT